MDDAAAVVSGAVKVTIPLPAALWARFSKVTAGYWQPIGYLEPTTCPRWRSGLAQWKECLAMSLQDKIANKAQVLKGKAKEAAGRISHDRGLRAEGKLDQGMGELKQAGEKLKDVGRRVLGR